jgi:DnaK suppressor protein
MNEHKRPHLILDKAFLDAQRERLISLGNELVRVADRSASEEETLQHEAGGEAHDDADGAEQMAIQENDEAQFHRNLKRLPKIRRAIEKLDDGTYGYSDKSGDPISRPRLVAVPEATLTLSEEQQEEDSNQR